MIAPGLARATAWREPHGCANAKAQVGQLWRQQNRTFGVKAVQAVKEASMRGFIIGVLLVAVGVLGYLYWDSEHNTVFKAPGVEIKKN
jgi:hypothetical protein